MLTIQSAMLVLLGFSAAGLLVCILAPMYRRRAERLATVALKRAMPLTEAEIAADKDRIRAEYAIRIHKLETKLSDSALESARQLVEINRRDASISALEGEVARFKTTHEEHENARRVLELTITERLPRVEQRLAEAKKLLFERDREIASLTATSQRQAQALEEATQINTQQRDEVHRLSATLSTRAARNREAHSDQRFETEVALRTEIEALRARARDQAALISRLQAGAAASIVAGEPNGVEAAGAAEIARLRESLANAERALQSAGPDAAMSERRAQDEKREADLRTLKASLQDQATEIARLKASLAAYENAQTAAGAGTDSPVTLRAKVEALEAQTAEQMSTILGLRAEVAATNEKLARQASYYMDEMRRLGAGTRPATGAPRAPAVVPAARPSLSERIGAPRVAKVEIAAPVHASVAADAGAVAQAGPEVNGERPSVAVSGDEAADTQSKPARRPGLLQRITGIEKPVAGE